MSSLAIWVLTFATSLLHAFAAERALIAVAQFPGLHVRRCWRRWARPRGRLRPPESFHVHFNGWVPAGIEKFAG